MPQASQNAAVNSSRLARFLSELGLVGNALPPRDFADKLGQLIDLSGSITLSEALRGLRRVARQSESVGGLDARAQFVAAREQLIERINTSFTLDSKAVSEGRASFILPSPNADTGGEDAAGYAPYQRFYALHQSEMDHQILGLRAALRKQLSGHSDVLAKLAALDSTVADTVAEYSRRSLAVVPKLLAQHFFQLRDAYRRDCEARGLGGTGAEHWLAEGGWLAKFQSDMQQLLLAELTLRLQPVQALLDALEGASEGQFKEETV